MSASTEVLHDTNPNDPHAWQPIGTLAATLAIAERTVRARLAAGTVERLAGQGGRSYYRVPPASAASSATDGSHGRTATGSRQAVEEAFALVVREHTERTERLATELGHARATVEQLERVRQLEAEAQLANRRALELELANVRQAVTSTEAELATVRQAAESERARSARLEALARAPWYAVRVRRRIRRELATA